MGDFGALYLFVISIVVFFAGALLHRWLPWRDRFGQVGAFLIVYMATLLAWQEKTDPTLWLQVGVAVLGVIFLRVSAVREGRG